MNYRIEFTRSAERAFCKLARAAQIQLQTDIQTLASTPRPHGCKKLKGAANRWRIRSGDYRVIYEIRDDVLIVLIVALGHRRDIYN